jgi:5-methyltetrahydrofolate corrinoid/iron sulfur protein methyltransferase
MATPSVETAVKNRDAGTIRELASRQVEAGASMVSIDLGVEKGMAADLLVWLVNVVQSEVDIPLALRCSDPAAIEAGLRSARRQMLIDATSPAITDMKPFMEAAARFRAKLSVAACAGPIPTRTEKRVETATEVLLPQALEAGIPLGDIYVDPFVTSLTCDQPDALSTVDTLRLLKVVAQPVPHTLVHLRDISDGTSARVQNLINRTYLAMLMGAGLDAVVTDPLDAETGAVIRIIEQRDGRTPLSRLILRLRDVTAAEVTLDVSAVDEADPRQVAMYKTVQILTNEVLYADGYLSA